MKNLLWLLVLIVLPGCDKVEEWWISAWYPNSVVLVDRCMELNKSQLSIRGKDDIRASCAAKYEKPVAFNEVSGRGSLNCVYDRLTGLRITFTNHSNSIITRFNASLRFVIDDNEDYRKSSFSDRVQQQRMPDLNLWISPGETQEILIPAERSEGCSKLSASTNQKGSWWFWEPSRVNGISTDVR